MADYTTSTQYDDFGRPVYSADPSAGTANLGDVASRISGALRNLSNPAGLVSSLRSVNVPRDSAGAAFAKTTAEFGGTDNMHDWRVRLSIPPDFFAKSKMFAPLMKSGMSLVFPYTPTITINQSASYQDLNVTHQNYQFFAYQSSRIEQISINAPFNVEDAMQAQYWIAALHFFRSATKMYTGDVENFGSPPPILRFNAYGDYVFKNVPVIIKSFTIDLPQDVDYIATDMEPYSYQGYGDAAGGGPSNVQGAAATSSPVAGLGGVINAATQALGIGKPLDTIMRLGQKVANPAQGLSVGTGTSPQFQRAGNKTHVPTKSSFNVVVQPIYSKDNVRTFSLQKFVDGAYINNEGYV